MCKNHVLNSTAGLLPQYLGTISQVVRTTNERNKVWSTFHTKIGKPSRVSRQETSYYNVRDSQISGNNGSWTNSDDVVITELTPTQLQLYTRALGAYRSQRGNSSKKVKNVIKALIVGGMTELGAIVSTAMFGPESAPIGAYMGEQAGGALVSMKMPKKKKVRSEGGTNQSTQMLTVTRTNTVNLGSYSSGGKQIQRIRTVDYTDTVTASTTFICVRKLVQPCNVNMGRNGAIRGMFFDEYRIKSITVELIPNLPQGNTLAPGQWGIGYHRHPRRATPTSMNSFMAMEGARMKDCSEPIVWKYSPFGRTTEWKFLRFATSQSVDPSTDDGTIYIAVQPGALATGTTIGFVKITTECDFTGRVLPSAVPGGLLYFANTVTNTNMLGTTITRYTPTGVLMNATCNFVNNTIALNGLQAGDNFVVNFFVTGISAAVAAPPSLSATNCAFTTFNTANAISTYNSTVGGNTNITYFFTATGQNPTLLVTVIPSGWNNATGIMVQVFIVNCNSETLESINSQVNNSNFQSINHSILNHDFIAGDGFGDIGPPPMPQPLPEPIIDDGCLPSPEHASLEDSTFTEEKHLPTPTNGNFVDAAVVESLSTEEMELVQTMRRARLNASK